jgi:molybdopterin molybdotransferase
MLELEQALAQIMAAVPPPVLERVSLADAHGRVLGESVVSALDLPPFDNSAMDGYALRADDVATARSESPVRLRLVGRVPAGEVFAGEVQPGTCVRLFTGSHLPRGADAVVMQEDTRTDPNQAGAIEVLDRAQPWENVRLRGEDLKSGARLAEVGERLTAAHLGLFSAAGVTAVSVGRRPRVALLATGSELREIGDSLGSGQIYESNRIALAALLRDIGGIPHPLPLVTDELGVTRRSLETAFSEHDAVVTSGGVSVGEMDFLKPAFAEAGGDLGFWKVAIRPGRPFVFGRWPGGKLLFGLPGNPVSAFVTFLLLVRPALLRWQGARETALPTHTGILIEPLANPGPRRHFVRVRVNAEGHVSSAGVQASHILSSLAAANGLVEVPPQTTFSAKEQVRVMRWE